MEEAVALIDSKRLENEGWIEHAMGSAQNAVGRVAGPAAPCGVWSGAGMTESCPL